MKTCFNEVMLNLIILFNNFYAYYSKNYFKKETYTFKKK